MQHTGITTRSQQPPPAQLPPPAGVKTISDLGEQEEAHPLQEGTQTQCPCSTGDNSGCVSSSSEVQSFRQKELLPAMTHFTQDLLSKAKFGEFSVSSHCFDSETPEDVMGASMEQPWTAQVTKDPWAGPELCLWLIFTQ